MFASVNGTITAAVFPQTAEAVDRIYVAGADGGGVGGGTTGYGLARSFYGEHFLSPFEFPLQDGFESGRWD